MIYHKITTAHKITKYTKQTTPFVLRNIITMNNIKYIILVELVKRQIKIKTYSKYIFIFFLF